MSYFEIETQLLTFRKDILPYKFAYHLILQNRNGNRKVEWGEWGVHPLRTCRSRNFIFRPGTCIPLRNFCHSHHRCGVRGIPDPYAVNPATGVWGTVDPGTGRHRTVLDHCVQWIERVAPITTPEQTNNFVSVQKRFLAYGQDYLPESESKITDFSGFSLYSLKDLHVDHGFFQGPEVVWGGFPWFS